MFTAIGHVLLGLILGGLLAVGGALPIIGFGLLRVPVEDLEAGFRVTARVAVPRGGRHRAVEPFHLPRRRHRAEGGVWVDEPDEEWGDVLTREVDADRLALTAGTR